MAFFFSATRLTGWLDRNRVVGGVFVLLLYAAVITFGAFASSNDAYGTNSPWPGALGVGIGLPLTLWLCRSRWQTEPTGLHRDEHERNYERQTRW